GELPVLAPVGPAVTGRHRLLPAGQPLIHGVDVELFGVELTLEPFAQLVVTFMVRVALGLDELQITPGTPHVLGWASPLAVDADRIGPTLLGRQELLDHDLVLPTVAEVVSVV